MLVKKAYKYRLYPSKQEEAALAVQFNCARFVYNMALAAKVMNENPDPAKEFLAHSVRAMFGFPLINWTDQQGQPPSNYDGFLDVLISSRMIRNSKRCFG